MALARPDPNVVDKVVALLGRPNTATDIFIEAQPNPEPKKRPGSFHPWLGTTNEELNDACGKIYRMRTSYDAPVSVWVPTVPLFKEYRYFCHGWGMQTFDETVDINLHPAMYTITTTSMANVLWDPALFLRIREEERSEKGKCRLVQDANNPIRPKDVIAFWGRDAPTARKERFFPQLFSNTSPIYCMHTALIEQAVYQADPRDGVMYLDNTSIVSSKNGSGPLKQVTTLGEVMQVYSDSPFIGIYRRVPAPAPGAPAASAQARLATFQMAQTRSTALEDKFNAH